MKYTTIPLILAGVFLSSAAYAQTPVPWTVQPEGVTPVVAQQGLQKELRASVFTAKVRQMPMHAFAESGAIFDGAVVAVPPDAVKDVVTDAKIEERPADPAPGNPSSFFGRGLERSSSPFAAPAPANTRSTSTKQYYLTTADWLNRAESLEIDLFGRPVAATVEYRDDAQNIAILSTSAVSGVRGVPILAPDDVLPALAYVLLSPGSVYESLTSHAVYVIEPNRYGTANIATRNGYPLFTAQGGLIGLSVGPFDIPTRTRIVHPAQIDRALHPKKYDRTTVEDVKLIEY